MNCSRLVSYKLYLTVSSPIEILSGILAILVTSVLFYAVKTCKIYPPNVLFILKCSLTSTISMLTTKTLFGAYDLVNLIMGKSGFGKFSGFWCFGALLIDSVFSSVILPFYTVLILERWFFVRHQHLQETEHVSLTLKLILATILVFTTVVFSWDMWQPEKIYSKMCDCSAKMFQSSHIYKLILGSIVYCFMLIIGTILSYWLYRHYRKMYRKFNILSTTHNLQKRFELMTGKQVLMSLFAVLLIMLGVTVSFFASQACWKFFQVSDDYNFIMDTIRSTSVSLDTCFVSGFWIFRTRPLKQRVAELIVKKFLKNYCHKKPDSVVQVRFTQSSGQGAKVEPNVSVACNQTRCHQQMKGMEYKICEKTAADLLMADWLATEKAIEKVSIAENGGK